MQPHGDPCTAAVENPPLAYASPMQSRNVDPQHPTQPFPAALEAVLHRLHALPEMPQVCCFDGMHDCALPVDFAARYPGA